MAKTKKTPSALLDRYARACVYPGVIDPDAVDSHLRTYLAKLNTVRDVARIEAGWTLDSLPALDRCVSLVAAAADITLSGDAERARFASWCVHRGGWWQSWDMSRLAIAHVGASPGSDVVRWTEPVFEAFCAGCWFLFWTEDTLYWVAKPKLHLEVVGGGRRLHREDGPAVESDLEPLYYWHGVLVPARWIEQRDALDPNEVIKVDNVERRAAGAAICGWAKMERVLKAKVIHDSGSPSVGKLIEMTLPGLSEPGRFLKAVCPRNGPFVEGVPHTSDIDGRPINTARAAQAWRIGDAESEYEPPPRRT